MFLTDQGDNNWYIYNGPQKAGRTELIKRLKTLGLIFTKENSQNKIVVTSQQWTTKYILYKAPNEVRF